MTTEKTKDVAFQFKLDSKDKPGTFEGYVSVFGNVDAYNEKVMPGAFSEGLAQQKREGRKPLMLWMHDTREPIGVWLDLSDDGKGLWGKGELLIDQNVPTADKAYSLVKAGAVNGMSIGYREIDVEPGQNGEPTKLVKLMLMEASIVSFPANRRAVIDAVKNESEGFRLLAKAARDGAPLPIKCFEEALREVGFSKNASTFIASKGYASFARSESGEEAHLAIDQLMAAVAKLKG